MQAEAKSQASGSARTAHRRNYLMCKPTYYDVNYSINPWMNPDKPTSAGLAVSQWQRLHDTLVGLGHEVELIDPEPGLPDMVFAANGATVVDGRALVARFRYGQRADEATYYLKWLQEHGYPEARQAEYTGEGEGDFLLVGDVILAGSGFRTDVRAHAEAAEFFGRTVVGLTLVDPHFYHLDTALAVLGDDDIMYNPRAFSPESLEVLEERYPDAILAAEADAAVFGLNAVSDGRNVILPQEAVGLMAQLRERGYEPIGADMSELLKAGGASKCCVLELRTKESG
ncbi:dimethylargininase [Streptomyces sp. NPDC041068]|uniref:dimethylargininase n=1 Tax=Streptomyces sp. NPDC041068 TaxID=3155130 RepID=UPI0033CA4093